MMAAPRVRALVETSKSVAEIRVLVQLAPDLVVPWRWDLPYLLWAAWGTERTARWLTDQFHKHDGELSRLVGAEAVCQALRRALEVHHRFFRVAWLASL